ncbi:hypothetical protein R1flu_004696 [Riccia fluitans]|uniref:Uncharacterized protein n=1 Tax=Riccia fluitans TaxID=41844 RepID=A0ABD1YV19_9MARC
MIQGKWGKKKSREVSGIERRVELTSAHDDVYRQQLGPTRFLPAGVQKGRDHPSRKTSRRVCRCRLESGSHSHLELAAGISRSLEAHTFLCRFFYPVFEIFDSSFCCIRLTGGGVREK